MTTGALDAVTGTPELALPHAGWLRRLERFIAREALAIGLVGSCVALWTFASTYWIAADTWLALVGGREIGDHGIPRADSLTILGHGRPWIDQQWLAQLALSHTAGLGGLRLLALVDAALLALSLALAVAVARRRGAAPAAIVPFALLPLPVLSSFVRPQLFSQVLFVGLVALLLSESRRPSPRAFLALPLLVVWANLHGAAVEGAALVSLLGLTEALARRGRLRALLLVVAPWPCLLATPYGLSTLDYYRSTLWNPALRATQLEWMPPTHSAPAALIAFPLVAAAVVLAVRRREHLGAFELAALAVTAAGAILATRSIVWFAYTALAVLPPLVLRAQPSRRRRTRRLAVGFALAAGLAATAGVVTAAASPASRYDRRWPPAAADTVRRATLADASLTVFASPEYADWLLFEIPQLRGRIAYDGRWELLRPRTTLAVWRYLHGGRDAARSPAAGYRLVVLDGERERGLATALAGRPGVHTLYRSRSIVVLERGGN